MLSSALSPLVVLLGLAGISNAQTGINFGTCDYEEVIEVGRTYRIFNPGYQFGRNYTGGTACRWTARSDRPIKMSCNPFEVPESPRCSVDVVIVQTSTAPGQRYCGTGTFNVTSQGNQLITTLLSSWSSTGGRFLCTIETATIQNEECRCGWKNPTRIVGGQDTAVNEYPMMAGLVDPIEQIVICGSTIINNKQVVTAAHCVAGKNRNELAVLVGDHDLSRRNDTDATKLFKVASYVVHPQYLQLNPEDYDIALVTVDGTISFNQQVGPACLPFQHSPDTFAGNFVDVLGWGTTDFAGGTSNILQKISISVLTNKVCRNTYENISARQLCTLGDGKDACQFDSGGPVLWHNPTTRRLVLVALVSYGSICADGTPGVNSRLGPYVDWILTQTPAGFQYCESE